MTTEARRITEKILNGEELTDDEKFTTEEFIAGMKIIAKLGLGITTEQAIENILGHKNEKIIVNGDYMPEEGLVKYYHNANC